MEAIILHKWGAKIGLLQQGFAAENIKTKSKAWEMGKELNQDILDTNILMLHCNSPKSEIIDIIPKIRSRKYALPIGILDETNSELNKKLSEHYGADGYFEKPFRFRSICMALKNIICKKELMQGQKWIRAWSVWLDLEKRLARRKNHIIILRNKEFALLEFFIMNRGKVLTRSSIIEHVWDRNADFDSNTVDVHINRLRRKLDDPFAEKLIHTVHCVGYSFDKKKKIGR